MTDLEGSVRTIVWMPRDLHARLHRAADACGEAFPDFIRHRLADSLPVSQAAPRSGCAGNGEAAVASPALDH